MYYFTSFSSEGSFYMFSTFKGGIHPDSNKSGTAASPIEKMPQSPYYIFPLTQHIGAPCTPLVSVGDHVCLGQKLADSESPLSAPIFSSVSGTVTAIEPRYTVSGYKTDSIVIENDFKDTVCDTFLPLPENKTFEEYTSEEIIDIARNAVLVGMGGAAFPTSFKLKCALDKQVDTVIFNGSECEPYITSDHRAMLEYPRFIFGGIKLILKCLHLDKAYIAIEDNKKDAIETMRSFVEGTKIEVKELKTKYPQGGEKQLIRSVLGYEIAPGKLPLDAGVVIFNIDTCAALYRAVYSKLPLTKRIVTVSGEMVTQRKNLLVRLGTPIADVINYCGGLKNGAKKIVIGGPMMGFAQHSLEVPIVKSSSAVLALEYDAKKYDSASNNCIRCGKCIDACPMKLMPNIINLSLKNNAIEDYNEYNVSDCVECGSCAYVCPQRLHLVQAMRIAKEEAKRSVKKNG